MKKALWRLKDIIDFEYFLYKDERDSDTTHGQRAQRNRAIYLEHVQPHLADKKDVTGRLTFKLWLDRRKQQEKEAHADFISPGDAFAEIHRILLAVFLLVGGMSGSGAAWSLLSYTGREPINIFRYLSALVLFQIALLIAMGVFFLIRSTQRTFFQHSLLYSLLNKWLIALVFKLRRQTTTRLSAARRTGAEAALGVIKSKMRVYGSVVYLPVFLLTHSFGVGFNLGVLAATLLKVMTTDLAFGWQSTLQISPQGIYRLTQTLALPWSWLFSAEQGYPTLAQIEGSRIILKDGIQHLATQDLVSWWTFLCLAILFYGLLPRGVLFLIGAFSQRRKIKHIDLMHGGGEKLLHTMQTPVFATQGGHDNSIAGLPGIGKRLASVASGDIQASAQASAVALIPDEIFDECPQASLAEFVMKTFGRRINVLVRVGIDPESDEAAINGLPREVDSLLLLQEAWQPPIRETLDFLGELRRRFGERFPLLIGLIGTSAPDTIFTPVAERDWQIWKQHLDVLGDPYMRIERLVDHETA